jgi:hypothetical protein
VDATPGNDREFRNVDGTLVARRAADADEVDLLSAVVHEIGHVLGYAHEDGAHVVDGLASTLASGERVLPQHDAHDAIAASVETFAAVAPKAIDATALTETALAPVFADVVARWTAALDDPALAAEIASLQIRVADLDGLRVSQVGGNTVWIDVNAAGYGWFVDASPRDEVEFAWEVTDDLDAAGPESAAFAKMDLVSVLAQSIGEVLGYGGGATDDSLAAAERFFAGTRVTPEGLEQAGAQGEAARVSRSAEIGQGVSLGDGVRVHAKASIGDGTTVGAGTVVGKKAVIGANVRIGDNVVIERGAVVPAGSIILAGSRVGGPTATTAIEGETSDIRRRLQTLIESDYAAIQAESGDDADDRVLH